MIILCHTQANRVYHSQRHGITTRLAKKSRTWSNQGTKQNMQRETSAKPNTCYKIHPRYASVIDPAPASTKKLRLTDGQLGLHGVFQRLVRQRASANRSVRCARAGRPSPRDSLRVRASGTPANTRCRCCSEVVAIAAVSILHDTSTWGGTGGGGRGGLT